MIFVLRSQITTLIVLCSLLLSTNAFLSPPQLGRQFAHPEKISNFETQRAALLDPYVISSTLTATADISSSPFNVENIKNAFSVATFLPQPFWVLLILFPNAKITRKIMGEYGIPVITLFCLVHFFIVFSSILQPDGTAPLVEFNDVFNPAGDPQGAMMGMMKYPNFVSEEWSHVLTWDLFVGRWVWMDGLKKRSYSEDGEGVFTGVSVLFCNLIGPPGFLIHLVTSLFSGKGLPGNYEDFDEFEES